METFPTYSGYIDYPISKLDSLNFNENALIELVVDDYGNGDYVNRKTTIGTFYDFLISSHPIFNKIDDVYNDKSVSEINDDTNTVSYRYASDIYISGQTYFDKNPFSYDKTAYVKLFNNQTVQRKQLEKFIHDNTLEINAIKSGDTIVQYGVYGWDKSESDSTNPRLDMTSLVKFAEPSQDTKIINDPDDSTIPLTHTNAISFYSNVFATIVGKVKIPNCFKGDLNYRMPYYSPETNLWVGVWEGKNIIAISELHNIENNVAYFSFQMPMAKNTNYYIVVPFSPGTSSGNEEQNTNLDLFSKIPVNSVSIFYYSTGISDNQKPETYFGKPS